MKEKKVIGPIWGCILFTALGCALYMLVGGGLGGIIDGFIGTNAVVASLLCCAISIIFAVIYTNANKPLFDGCFKSENMGLGFIILLPVLVFALITLVLAAAVSKHRLGFTPSLALTALYAGVCEEITYRAVPAAHMMRCYNEPKKLIVVMLLTSFLFSIIHATNLFSGAAVGFTVVQLLRAFTIGLLLCASYLRTGSIIPAIVLHFLNDFIVFFDADMYSASGIGTDASMMSTGDIILGLVFDVVFAVLAFYVVRPAKRDEIMAIWAKKWSKK